MCEGVQTGGAGGGGGGSRWHLDRSRLHESLRRGGHRPRRGDPLGEERSHSGPPLHRAVGGLSGDAGLVIGEKELRRCPGAFPPSVPISVPGCRLSPDGPQRPIGGNQLPIGERQLSHCRHHRPGAIEIRNPDDGTFESVRRPVGQCWLARVSESQGRGGNADGQWGHSLQSGGTIGALPPVVSMANPGSIPLRPPPHTLVITKREVGGDLIGRVELELLRDMIENVRLIPSQHRNAHRVSSRHLSRSRHQPSR
jgi:hypothetical protein